MTQKEKYALMKFSALGDIASIEPYVKILADKYDLTFITSPIGYEYYKEYENIKFIILKNKNSLIENSIIFWKLFRFVKIIDLQANDRSKILTFGKRSKLISNYVTSYQVKAIDNENIKEDSVFHLYIYSVLESLISSEELLSKTHYQKSNAKFIVLNCGSSPKWFSKRLPDNVWCKISKELHERYKLPFYLTGDKSEVEYLERLSKVLVGEIKIVAGKTSLQDLKILLKDAFLTVSTDSAAMHISAVQGTPTIGVFGATNWIRSAPFGKWTTVVFDKTYFTNSKPFNKNSLVINESIYKQVDIKDSINKLQKYLGV